MIDRRRRFGAKFAVLSVAALGLSACGGGNSSDGPIAWYRDLSGNSAHDAQDKAPNSQNLKQGSKEPYPNLASVPAPPSNAITKADRDRLAKSLIADRQNAQYTDQQLRAGQDMSAIPPPPPQAAIAPAPVKSAAAPAAAPKVTAAPRAPVAQQALAAPAAKPVPRPNQQVAAVSAATMAPIDDSDKADEAKKKRADEARKKAAEDKKRQVADDKKKSQTAKRGAEAPPEESSLRSPTIGAMPQGEQARAAPPPPPNTPAARRPAEHEEIAAATSDSEAAAAKGSPRTAQAQINFSPGPFRARILPADQRRLTDVARMARANNARIRVVGYGGAAAQGDLSQREFQSFDAALDNAKAVAVALTKLGVPADRIDVETVANVNSPDRAEVFLDY